MLQKKDKYRMKYDFSAYFDEIDLILNEFIENYTLNIDSNKYSISTIVSRYKKILECFLKPFEEKQILSLFVDLAEMEISIERPYTIVSNEIYSLQNIIIKCIVSQKPNVNILLFLNLFNKLDNKVAEIYLNRYIDQLLSINNVRIASLSDLVHKNIIKHYESHLVWLSSLARYVKNKDKSFKPEPDESKCDFGMWLDTLGKVVIKNNSKYNTIKKLHENLHMYGNNIENYIDANEEHIVITYLEKCELLSLSIGTELALIDNIIMNSNITKDKLTGALNRHALDNVFMNQYELSLATKNSFVLAMCDLDLFKMINDNFGHVAGDKVLKHFIKIAKMFTRASDIIIRFGGEEFVFIFPAIEEDSAYKILDKIRLEFSNNSVILNDTTVKATVSIGMIEVNPQSQYRKSFLEKYLDLADKNLYCAKKSGRNQIIKNIS